ncbi:2-hydroxyacid dehydrogenase [Amaricoccus solimangrovi]|uniref:2-hydroxyacid dehydrogenase n=2 Tax=Amaricoccus solimangrovi TaxID=2589815 RepID=A0A501WMN2_9RHOB|nr:2-hydroxyacid dehydrogenase [Amaricoccus solimangrovi]
MLPGIEAELDARFTVHRFFAEEEAARAARPRIRCVVTGGGSGFGNDWIEAMPELGIIAINGVGTDRVDLGFARSRGIDVTTTPGTLTDDVADLGMALMLALMRRVVEGDAYLRAGRWAAGEPFPLGASPRGRRLGILGLGQIGRALGQRAEAFGMKVRYWNRRPVEAPGWTALPDPVALAADSDVLAVCVAATAETRGVVGADVLEALGPAGLLVNIARGSVVDEPALIAALSRGGIAGAGLDVFENEPAIRTEFLNLPNSVLMPHQASATLETRIAMGELVLANLAAHLAGERPPSLVN